MDIQWVNKGYPSLITDPAPPQEVGGPTKIDSIQNVILLRSDLHGAWDNYQIAVNPDVCINFFLFMVSVLTIARICCCPFCFRNSKRRGQYPTSVTLSIATSLLLHRNMRWRVSDRQRRARTPIHSQPITLLPATAPSQTRQHAPPYHP